MKNAIVSLAALVAAGFGLPALTEGKPETTPVQQEAPASDVDKLHALVKQARAELREMRKAAGLQAHAAGPHIDPDGHHANDSEAQRERERAEGDGHEDGRGHEGRREGGEHREGREGGHEGRERGEHGEGRERGEHGGEGRADGRARIAKMQKHDAVYRNGMRLILQYNPNTEAFVGSVQNTTRTTQSQARVEIHLSNGVELGPTRRVDLKPGQTIPVELGAFGEAFTTWTTHPESGSEHGSDGEESGAGHEERERGEHGGRGEGRGEHGEGRERGERGEHGGERPERSDKPSGAALHPVYNQLRLLQGEMKAFKADLAARNKR